MDEDATTVQLSAAGYCLNHLEESQYKQTADVNQWQLRHQFVTHEVMTFSKGKAYAITAYLA